MNVERGTAGQRGIASSSGSLCWRASSEGSKAPGFWLEDPRVCKEKKKAPGTNLGYSTVVSPKESPSAPFPAKKNLQPDIALHTLGPMQSTKSWGRRKITKVISWGKDHEDRLTLPGYRGWWESQGGL